MTYRGIHNSYGNTHRYIIPYIYNVCECSCWNVFMETSYWTWPSNVRMFIFLWFFSSINYCCSVYRSASMLNAVRSEFGKMLLYSGNYIICHCCCTNIILRRSTPLCCISLKGNWSLAKVMACRQATCQYLGASGGARWRHRSGSRLVQAMTCCLKASDCLSQCWLSSVRSSDSRDDCSTKLLIKNFFQVSQGSVSEVLIYDFLFNLV